MSARPIKSLAAWLKPILLLAAVFFSASGHALQLGDRVQANGVVNVRFTPAGAFLGTQASGNQGNIIGGPQTASLNGTSYTWWSVNWDSGVDGWVADIGLTIVASTPTISGVSPNPVTGSASQQTITINGTNFVNKPTVAVAWTGGSKTLSAAQVTYVSSTQLQMAITTSITADSWTVRVTNPNGQSSNTASFTVTAPASPAPTVSGVSPNPVTGSASQQTITINGTNFANKPTVAVTWTGGGSTLSATQVTYVNSTQLQMAIMTSITADSWTVRVTNPDGQSSNTASFTVTAPVAAAPTISTFNVNPSTISLGQTFTISYTVADSGGPGLSRVVLRRTSGDGSTSDPGWQDISTNLVSGNGPVSGSFSNTPTGAGTYWYGMAVFDVAGNSKDERHAGLGPVQRAVTAVSPPTPSLLSPANGSSVASITAGTTSVTLQWSAVAPGYNIEVSTGSCGGPLFNGANTTLTSRTISGLTYGTTYYWRVQSSNSVGVSAYSSCFSFSVAASTITTLPKPNYPVIFIHGINSDAESAWGDFRRVLSANGWAFGGSPTFCPASDSRCSTYDDQHKWRVYRGNTSGTVAVQDAGPADFYTINFSSNHDLTFVQQGEELGKVIRLVLQANPSAAKVILVGHSMGGLAARAYLQGSGFSDDVQSLITIGTPNQGSMEARRAQLICDPIPQILLTLPDVARGLLCHTLNPFSVANRALIPGSESLDDLNTTANGVPSLPATVQQYTSVVVTWAKGNTLTSIVVTPPIVPDLSYQFTYSDPGDGIVTATSQDLSKVGLQTLATQLTKTVEFPADITAACPKSLPAGAAAAIYDVDQVHTCETHYPKIWEILLQNILGTSNVNFLVPATFIGTSVTAGTTPAFILHGSVLYPNNTSVNAQFRYGTTPNLNATSLTTPWQLLNPSTDIVPLSASLDTTGLSSGTTYYYQLVAQADANTAVGQVHEFTVPPTSGSLLPAPGGLTPVDGSSDQSLSPTLAWNAVPSATSYRVMLASDGGALPTDPTDGNCDRCLINVIVTSPVTTYMPPAGLLGAGTTYYWTVHARSPDNFGAWSPATSFITAANAIPTLPAPTIIYPVPSSILQSVVPTFSWSTISGATSYRIMAATNAANLPSDLSTPDCVGCVLNEIVYGSSYTPTSGVLQSGGTYYWEVKARSPYSFGSWSSIGNFGITATTGDTSPPTDGTLMATPGAGQIALSWTDFADIGSGINHYVLGYSQSSMPASCSDGTQLYSGTNTAFVHVSLNAGTTYYYRVCAVDNAGNPPSQGATASATVQQNQQAQSGSIRVSIVPQAAADAGAQWHFAGETIWHNSGEIVSGLSFNTYLVEFKAVSGWVAPPNQDVPINAVNPDIWVNSGSYALSISGDTTPDAFSFNAQSDVARNVLINSNSISISGINMPTSISIVGGEYSIDGGAYTSSPGTVGGGQSVTVRLMSSGSYGSTTSTVLTIGGISAVFNITTLANMDAASPILSITSPSDGTLININTIQLAGYATDAGRGDSGIASVSANGLMAAGGAATGNATANWTFNESLAPGTNYFTVVATDASPNANHTTQNLSVVYLPQLTDSSGDGMPDVWKTANGLNPGVDNAGGDADSDGYTNLEEYLAGSNPQDANSKPAGHYVLFRDHFDHGQYQDRWVLDALDAGTTYTLNESGTILEGTVQRPAAGCNALRLDSFGKINDTSGDYHAKLRINGYGTTTVGFMKDRGFSNRIEVQFLQAAPYLRLHSVDAGISGDVSALAPKSYKGVDVDLRLYKANNQYYLFVNNVLQGAVRNAGLGTTAIRPYLALQSCLADPGYVDTLFDLVEIWQGGPDLNTDGVINNTDLGILKTRFYKPDPYADFNGDGMVNFGDLAIMKAIFNWQSSTGGLAP